MIMATSRQRLFSMAKHPPEWDEISFAVKCKVNIPVAFPKIPFTNPESVIDSETAVDEDEKTKTFKFTAFSIVDDNKISFINVNYIYSSDEQMALFKSLREIFGRAMETYKKSEETLRSNIELRNDRLLRHFFKEFLESLWNLRDKPESEVDWIHKKFLEREED